MNKQSEKLKVKGEKLKTNINVGAEVAPCTEKGITLVALVITIIVLIILTGVSINAVMNQGLITNAKDASNQSEKSKDEEQIKLAQLEASANLNGIIHTEKLALMDNKEVSVTIPAGFALSPREGEQNIEKGMVIIDTQGNEYVWIQIIELDETSEHYGEWGVEYPEGLPSKDANESEFTAEHITAIRTALQNYTRQYTGNPYSDEWYGDEETSGENGYGYYDGTKFVHYTNGNMTREEYTNLYNSMLISVYKNGGFYIGRYEMGTAVVNSIEEAENNTRTKQSMEYTPSQETSGTTTNLEAAVKIGKAPIIKANAVPYIYITQPQAQMLAEKLGEENGYESVKCSIMFGIQWDIACAFLGQYGKVDSNAKNNAGESFTSAYFLDFTVAEYWGNYRYSIFKMDRGFYNIADSVTNGIVNFLGWGAQAEKTTTERWLCTTGSTNQNSCLNIFDFAGNVGEYTLESFDGDNDNCGMAIYRGGNLWNSSSPVNRIGTKITANSAIYSSRPALFIK